MLPSWNRCTPRYFLSVNVIVSGVDTCLLILSVSVSVRNTNDFSSPFSLSFSLSLQVEQAIQGSHGAWGVELDRVSQALSAGHHLVYSPCTFLGLVSLQTFPSVSFVLMFLVY